MRATSPARQESIPRPAAGYRVIGDKIGQEFTGQFVICHRRRECGIALRAALTEKYGGSPGQCTDITVIEAAKCNATTLEATDHQMIALHLDDQIIQRSRPAERQVKDILSDGKVPDDVLPASIGEDHEAIRPLSPDQHVMSRSADEHIITGIAHQHIVVAATDERVVSLAARNLVLSLHPEQPVIAVDTLDRVIAISAINGIIPPDTAQMIVTGIAREHVVGGVPDADQVRVARKNEVFEVVAVR